MAYFGEGEGPIHTDNVKCTGGEHSLIDCIKQTFGTHNCRHSEDAGVICNYGLQKDSPEVKGEVLHPLIATAFTYLILARFKGKFTQTCMNFFLSWNIIGTLE